MLEAIGVVVGLLGVIYGEVRARKAQRELDSRLGSIQEGQDALTRAMAGVLGDNLPDTREEYMARGSHERATGERITDPDRDLPVAVGYADVNNDGRPELLVQHPIGAHSSMLKVYGWRGDFPAGDFGEFGELQSSCPSSFHVEDIDGDGRLEVLTVDLDWNDMPEGRGYANGPRYRMVYRWIDDRFERVSQAPVWGPVQDADAPEEIERLYAAPRWASEKPPAPTA